MGFEQLSNKISAMVYNSGTEYILYSAGIKGKFHLGEKDVPGLHLIDATPKKVVIFIESRERK